MILIVTIINHNNLNLAEGLFIFKTVNVLLLNE